MHMFIGLILYFIFLIRVSHINKVLDFASVVEVGEQEVGEMFTTANTDF